MQRNPKKRPATVTKVGLLGCGSIGRTLAEALINDPSIGGRLVCAYDQNPDKSASLKSDLAPKLWIASSCEEFLRGPFDLLLECASQQAVRECAAAALRARKDLLILSVGALLDEALHASLLRTAAKLGRKIYLPSGAIGGLDLIGAAKEGKLSTVKLTTRKNPAALAGAPYFERHKLSWKDIREPTELYSGSAKQAVKLFPANVNVAASLSLAGLGGAATQVTVVADPALSVNVHEIEVKGDFGEAKLATRNVPHPANPKTSYLAALSAIAALRRACTNEPR